MLMANLRSTWYTYFSACSYRLIYQVKINSLASLFPNKLIKSAKKLLNFPDVWPFLLSNLSSDIFTSMPLFFRHTVDAANKITALNVYQLP
jgi:hypothetical protein